MPTELVIGARLADVADDDADVMKLAEDVHERRPLYGWPSWAAG